MSDLETNKEQVMSVLSYNDIVRKAKQIKQNVEKNYELGDSPKWSYYFAMTVLNPRKNIPVKKFQIQKKNTGNNFSRQIKKSDYVDMAKRFTRYVEYNKRLPNNIKCRDKLMRVTDYTYMFAWIVVFYDAKGKLPSVSPVNSKLFIRPTEPSNVVYDYFVKKTGKKFTTIDDFLEYVMDHYDYEYYYDDHKSNKEVIDEESGNCTDLLQMTVNMAEAMGYEWKCIHTQCRQSGAGHVYGKFRKGGDWFTRDVACIADESRYCIWCDVDNGGGYLLAENPYWFMENVNR